MSEQNMETVRRLLSEVWTEGNLSLLPELIAEDAMSHPMPQFGVVRGPEEYKQFIAIYKGAFHAMTFAIVDQFSSANKVATRWVSHVSDELGEDRPGALAGEDLTIEGTTITHHNDQGKIIAEWASWDSQSLLHSAAAPRILEQLSIIV